jgi:two-component sensor histidine kinase/tetratricopeptide (TPR) repeat protein
MKKVASYFIILFVFISNIQLSFAQNHQIDSLLALLKTDKEDTNKVKHLVDLSNTYLLQENDKSLNYGKQALLLAQAINFKEGVAAAFNNIGMSYYNEENFPEAIKNFKAAIQIREEASNKNYLAAYYINLGDAYRLQGNYADALKNFFSALKINEQNKDNDGIADTYNNIGNVYFYQNNYSEALKNYFITLKIKEETGDKIGIAASYQNIGSVFYSQNNYSEALKNFLISLKIYTQINNKEGIAFSNNNIGSVFNSQKKYNEALNNYFSSLKIFEEIGDKYETANSYYNIGELYTEIKKIKDAENYLNTALLLSKEIGSKDLIKSVYEELAILDSTTGNCKAAFEHHKLYLLYRDSLNNEETQKKIIQTAMQYEFDKKEAATKSENDKVILKLEDENKLHKQQRLFFVGFIILSLILLFFAKRAFDNKKKYSEILSQENEHKEILLQEVHHRVNNSLQMISSLLSIQADNTTNDEVREYLLKSENRVHAMSAMHELLFESNTKLEVDIRAYLLKVINFYANVLESKPNIKLETQIPEVTFHSKIALPLALIANELVTNAIKYGFPNNITGLIFISLSQNEGNKDVWKLKISDNGIGLPNAKNPEKENSLGLRLVNIMTRQIGGTLNITNQNGTCFEITFNG